MKLFLSVIILAGALGQAYNHYVNGITYNKLVPRDKRGFVIDSKKVKVTASEEDQKRYNELVSGELIKNTKEKIAQVEQTQQERIEKIDAIDPSVTLAGAAPELLDGKVNGTEGQGDVVMTTETKNNEQPPLELPSLPETPGAEEGFEESGLPQEKKPQADAQAMSQPEDINKESDIQPEELPEMPPPPVITEDTTEPTKAESAAAPLKKNEEPSVKKDTDNTDEKESSVAQKTENKEEPTSGEFDPGAELVKRGLMSCKTKNSKGRIPKTIWNYMVKNAKETEHVADGESTLPQLAESLLGDKTCWPKLWSLNPSVENPYAIPAGLTIVILPDEPEPRAPATADQ